MGTLIHELNCMVTFDLDYEVENFGSPARHDEPPSGPEFHVTRCTVSIFGKDLTVDYDDLPEEVRESLDDAIASDIEDQGPD